MLTKALMALVGSCFLLFASYGAAYVGLSEAETVCARTRHFSSAAQASFFVPAARIEQWWIRRPVMLYPTPITRR